MKPDRPATDVSADQEPRSRLHRGGTVADPAETRRSGEDQSAGCAVAGAALRAGDLTAVWVPDPHHEAVRDLTRARGAAVREQRAKRQQVSALLLRLGLHYPGNANS